MRNATVYGASPRLRLDIVLNNLVAWAHTTGAIRLQSDGTPWRPLVHVRDVAGNEVTTPDRSIWLSEDGSGPPNDLGPPQVLLARPFTGAVLPANETIQVVATVSDDSPLSRVDLLWTNEEEQSFPCPMETQGVSCAVEGNTYTWSLQVGTVGKRWCSTW
jgi:hypothetical protein